MNNTNIKTRFLILSDTHGHGLPSALAPDFSVDVLIHCGDLTDESKLVEFESTLKMISNINASLKLVIPGNHDFTLDRASYSALLEQGDLEIDLVEKIYGSYRKARDIFAAYPDIQLLEEGTYSFQLGNGARLRLYASPYTPSEGNMGFHYQPTLRHTWNLGEADVVITHGPPKGILDRTLSRERAGCPDLFAAVARRRPRLHCFGHIHEGWGAKLVRWRKQPSEYPSHLTDIDNELSISIDNLQSITPGKLDEPHMVEAKIKRREGFLSQGYCTANHWPGDRISLKERESTLFVNASIQATEGCSSQLPWLVDLALPRA